jgi:hypothetical protein
MTYTAQEAYDAIKNLESEDLIPLTLPSVTINVGTGHSMRRPVNFIIQSLLIRRIGSSQGALGRTEVPSQKIPMATTVGMTDVHAMKLLLNFTLINGRPDQFGVQRHYQPDVNQIT